MAAVGRTQVSKRFRGGPMSDQRSVRQRLLEAIEMLEATGRGEAAVVDADIAGQPTRELVATLTSALSTLAESFGECQIDRPYGAMYMVRRPDGTLQWCCTHDPQHCDPA